MKTLFGRKVAIDASMSIYQFLIAVRQQDPQMLTNEAGETTRRAFYVVCGTFPRRPALMCGMRSTAISWVSSTELYTWLSMGSNPCMYSTGVVRAAIMMKP